jgi:hypothetical protein
MTRLAVVITEAIVLKYGREELLRRLVCLLTTDETRDRVGYPPSSSYSTGYAGGTFS